eukprot:s1283_g6.t1
MGGKKEPLWMSELGCADGCRRRGCKRAGGKLEMSELRCADVRTACCGRRGCKGVGGNGWGEGAGGDERARMRKGGNGWGEGVAGDERAWMHGRLRGAREWVGGGKEPLGMSELGCADGCGRCGCKEVGGKGWGKGAAGDERAWMCGRLRTSELGCVDGCRRLGCKGVGGNGRGEGAVARTAADGVGAREWVEITDGEKELLGMSELGCADGCGRRGRKGVGGNGWGEKAAGDERAWMRGRLRTRLRTAWAQGSAGDERAWMRGMMAWGAGEWVAGDERAWGEEAAGNERAWLRGPVRGVVAREWVDMAGVGARGVGGNGWGGKPVGMSELGCADGCGRQLRTTAADGVGAREWGGYGWERRSCGGNERGTAADGVGPREGDERAWLRGRRRTARAQGNGWKWGEKKPVEMSKPAL